MARQLRIEYEGAFYHVFSRGNNKKNIFKTDIDRGKFLKIIGEAYDKYKILVHSYVLMKNHYHMIIETPQANLSKAMQYINAKYTGWFNYANKEVGHLFQGRYKAVLIDKEEYLLPLSRYIHLNPVRANYVKEPEKYYWSSLGSFINDSDHKCRWLAQGFILNAIGSKEKYKNYVMEFKQKEIENPFLKLKGQTFLCNDNFLEKIKKEIKEVQKISTKEVKDKKFLKNKITCEEIVDKITNKFNISKGEIVAKGKQFNNHRKLAIYLCKKYSGETNAEIGKYFGGVADSCVSYYYKLGEMDEFKDFINEQEELMGSGLKN